MGATVWRLTLVDGQPRVGDSDLPLELFFDGLDRIVFLEGRKDLEHISPGDLCVALGGVAGRTVGALKRSAAKLQRLGAVGLLAHANVLDAAPAGTAGIPDGSFPIVLIEKSIDWPDVLQPLMKIDTDLRGRIGTGESRRADLVREIIDNEGRVYVNPASALEVGLDLSLSTRCMFVTPTSTLPAASVMARLEEAVAFELLDHDPDATVISNDSAVIAFESGITSVSARDRFTSNLVTRARSLTITGVMIGAGRPSVGPEGMFRSFREAKWAARVGFMLHGADQLSEFETLGAFAWLEPIAFDRRRENVTEAIEMIVDRDARQGTRLLETLQVFLDARRLKEAADRLFVHRNTLRYRLDAISKLTGHDVQDPDGRLVLELQLRLAMVHGAIPTLEERSDLVVSEAPDVITLDDALVEPGPLAEEPSSN